MNMAEMNIVGVMSGTSLDGLDMVLAEFSGNGNVINYQIIKAKTLTYPLVMQKYLAGAHKLSGLALSLLHKRYGKFIGQAVKEFLGKDYNADFIASHGHTVFHNPAKQLTLQIGDGAFIAANSGIPTISDFRNIDTAFGGQGAPLVPVGDKLLFSDYDYCLNLGGFANISYDKDGQRLAFDICPVNIIANALAEKNGQAYDESGKMGSRGRLNEALITELNQLDYYKKTGPKSLGREYAEAKVFPIFEKYEIPIEDKLHTLYEHIAFQIKQATTDKKVAKILITGGGAYNSYLIRRIRALAGHRVIIPDDTLIQYKEALIFALLGLLRAGKANNVLASYTGAKRNTTGGVIHYV
jgi:anhydro-N-acetylmuramic acid kinase